ncbi:Sensor histidine kinase GlrK [hydrothermal vent metagenome]|uniref:histidine kinase n=1 Tax=hydrothermal vent metagenome TaxID=652676 RepID=A0A3B0Z8B7_9ZZZZ
MRLTLPTSIFQLVLIGFLLAALPLAAALVSTFMQIDNLSAQMQLAVRNSARAVEASRIIMTQALNLERSTGQYLVLRDPVVLQRYENQRVQLLKAIARLEDLPLGDSLANRLKQLRAQEKSLYRTLLAIADGSDPLAKSLPQNLAEQRDLAQRVRQIPMEVTLMITQQSNVMSQQVRQVQDLLLLHALSLIPLALILAVIFSVLISRPLRRLGAAIHRLGAAEFTVPVNVGGPQDIRELSDHLDWLRIRLSGLDEQKRIFLRHVSHELKTPLTAIREGAELLRDEVVGTLNHEQAEVAIILRESSLQLQSQVEALLDFNAALAQEKPLRQEPIALHTLLPEVIDKHRLAMRARKIIVKTELQVVSLRGEREQIRTLVDNLLSNAIKYSPDGGQIWLKLWAEDNQANIDIIDSGSGIGAEEQERIFEPFFQGKELARGHVKGTGLGLAIAQRYARLHRGDINVQDSAAGAHLHVTLPLATTE